MLGGISRIMIKDVNFDELKNVLATYDTTKQGKINLNSFMLAIANGMLDQSLRDPSITETL
jgi:Ca2+-binding EF-hand superfamily protein